MPLVGTREPAELEAMGPLVATLPGEQWELPGCQILQLMYEIDDEGMLSLLPPALHPTIPPTLVLTVTRAPESPVGPFVLAEARVGCRSGARPRGLLARGYCDSAEAVNALRDRWGYPLEQARVTLSKRYDRINASVESPVGVILEMSLMNPEPVSGNDLQYLATLNAARIRRDGADVERLIQVDPDFVFRSADRGRPVLTVFSAEAWRVPAARPVHPVSASYAVADVTMPLIRYLVDPSKPPLQSVERL